MRGVNFGGVSDKIVAEQPVDPGKCYYCQHGIEQGEPAKLVPYYSIKAWCHQGAGKNCADLLEQEERDKRAEAAAQEAEHSAPEPDGVQIDNNSHDSSTIIVGDPANWQTGNASDIPRGTVHLGESAAVPFAVSGQDVVPDDVYTQVQTEERLGEYVEKRWGEYAEHKDTIVLTYILGGHGVEANPKLIEQLIEWKVR